MAAKKEKVLAEALALSAKERELLALELWRSLDGDAQEQVWDAWSEEIHHRLEALERGQVKAIPGEQVMREARKLVRKTRTA
ncbi:MAG TPA: addiction module protein [Tepidisphaeraceae bacterium]|nr:addiction module protein [Tepidisphaeraceae bacterium]